MFSAGRSEEDKTMLKNASRDPPCESTSPVKSPPIPDPWELPSPALKGKFSPDLWKFPKETYPLIAPAGNPNALRLTAIEPNLVQVLLQDELKLKVGASKKLAVQLEKAEN